MLFGFHTHIHVCIRFGCIFRGLIVQHINSGWKRKVSSANTSAWDRTNKCILQHMNNICSWNQNTNARTNVSHALCSWRKVYFSFSRTSPVFHMPPPCSTVIQESEKEYWHVPIVTVEEMDLGYSSPKASLFRGGLPSPYKETINPFPNQCDDLNQEVNNHFSLDSVTLYFVLKIGWQIPCVCLYDNL